MVPPAGAALGAVCGACGAKLVSVADADPLIGTVVDGRFKVIERLGAGAMGIVYRATQLSIGRDVALKIMTGMDATSVRRFFREAQIASALSHPNTVQIIEFGQSPDGRVYLAMELVRGRTLLDEMAEHGALPSRRICQIAVQLSEALSAAHRQTIVHRDLKPENVMITTDGTDHVKILDFGIARVLGDAASQVTGVGLSAGTPNYMAPEVLGKGAEPEPPQDMYALGVMIAELALGRSLFEKQSLELLFVAKSSLDVVDEVPTRFRSLVKRLLDPEPARRPTAAETRKLLRDLDRAATDPVGIAATAASMPALLAPKDEPILLADVPLQLDVVDLGERTGAPPLAPAPTPAPRPPIEPLHPDVVNLAASDEKLELDGSWAKERAAKVAGKVAPSPLAARVIAEDRAARRHNSGLTFAILLVLAVAGAGVFLYIKASQTPSEPTVTPTKPTPTLPASAVPDAPKPATPPPATTDVPLVNKVPDRGIAIRIIGSHGTPVTIDGAAAGKSPVSLKRRASTREMVIGANGKQWKIVPDHDQTIDISR